MMIATDTGDGSVQVMHQKLVHFYLNSVCFQNLTALISYGSTQPNGVLEINCCFVLITIYICTQQNLPSHAL